MQETKDTARGSDFEVDEDPFPADVEGLEEKSRRVNRVMEVYRPLLTEAEWEARRRFLLFLAKTHPRSSTWIEDRRPRALPDSSGPTVKKDMTALAAAVPPPRRRAGGGGEP